MKILVLGAGGIGGYFGGRLMQAGADVTFLVRPARQAQLQRDGLRIESPLGNATLPVQTVTDAGRAAYGLVLLTCKAYDLGAAIDAIAPAMREGCGVVPMLNGMAHLDRLDERFGRSNVLGGSCTINVTLRKDGVVQQLSPLQRITFGERDGTRSARAQALADAFAKTSVECTLSERILDDMWEKIVALSALAATTCLFRANIGEIVAAPGGRAAIERTLDANIAIATAEGHPPREATVAFARKLFSDPASTTSASMLRDLESGGQVESDHVVGWMLGRAHAHGVDDTMLSLAYTHLKAYEARRGAGRLAAS